MAHVAFDANAYRRVNMDGSPDSTVMTDVEVQVVRAVRHKRERVETADGQPVLRGRHDRHVLLW